MEQRAARTASIDRGEQHVAPPLARQLIVSAGQRPKAEPHSVSAERDSAEPNAGTCAESIGVHQRPIFLISIALNHHFTIITVLAALASTSHPPLPKPTPRPIAIAAAAHMDRKLEISAWGVDCESVVCDIMKLAALPRQSRISLPVLAQVLRAHADYSEFSEWLNTSQPPSGSDTLNRDGLVRVVFEYSKGRRRPAPMSTAVATAFSAAATPLTSTSAKLSTKVHNPIGVGGANVVRKPSGLATLLAQGDNLLGRLEAIFPHFIDAISDVSQPSRTDLPADIESFAADFSALAGRTRRCADQAEQIRNRLSVLASQVPSGGRACVEWLSDVDLAKPLRAPLDAASLGAVQHCATADRAFASKPQIAPARLRVADSFPEGAKQLVSQSGTVVQLAGRDGCAHVLPRSPLAAGTGARERHVPEARSRWEFEQNELGFRVPLWSTQPQSSQQRAFVAPKPVKPQDKSDSEDDVLTMLGQGILNALEEVGETWGEMTGWA
jgi:hypothetical protein